MFLRKLFIVVAWLTLGFPQGLLAETAQPRGNVFQVKANIYAGDVLIGQPQISVVAGSEVAMGVSTPRGYGMRITVDDDALSRGTNAIKINAKLYFVRGSEWVLVGAPEIHAILGAKVRQSASGRTVYGDGGYTVEFEVIRSDQTVTPAEFFSVENCPTWKAMSGDGPLEGVRIRGTKVQDENSDLPFCCTSGNMTCCGSAAGICCRDGMTGNSCCTS